MEDERPVESRQPFAGIKVIELGQFVAVPYAGQMLADGGAHVIKVEPPEGEPSRHLAPLAPGESRHFVMRNRGKHALPLDLKHAHAREILDALLARADVVLTNLRPGLTAELGSRLRAAGGAVSPVDRRQRHGLRGARPRRRPRGDGHGGAGAERAHDHRWAHEGRAPDHGRVALRGLHGGRPARLRHRLGSLSARADRARAPASTSPSSWPPSCYRTT